MALQSALCIFQASAVPGTANWFIVQVSMTVKGA